MIVISGASGFIGRRLAARVKSEYPGATLKCLAGIDDDAFCRTGTEYLVTRGIRPVLVDLISGEGLQHLRSPKILFHLAANTHTWEKDQRCNDLGTENLLEEVEPIGPDHHVIFTSTVAVMDNRNDLSEPLRADTPIHGKPLTAYGTSKLKAEEHLRTLARKSGFRLSIVRLCTVYGPQPRPNTFFEVLKREVARRSIATRLNWPGLTSFVHVDDVVSALLALAASPPCPGETRIFLLATDTLTVAAVSRLVYQAMGIPYRQIALPNAVWRILAGSHLICRSGRSCLPASLCNALWRFNLVVNPVFYCDTNVTVELFASSKRRRIGECIDEI